MSKISRTKRPLSIILSLLLIFSSVPLTLTAFAETEYTSDDGYLTYEVENGEVTITDCDTTISGDYEIPSTLGGCPVTAIGNNAFEKCKSLTSVTIPDSITSIGNSVFHSCTSLTSVSIPDSVTSLGYYTFYGCKKLSSVTIGSGVTTIGSYNFYGCTSLVNITIPDSVTSIAGGAFRDCTSLTAIVIPDSVTSIGTSAFHGCTSLTNVTIPNSITSIGTYVFRGCTSLESIEIPDSVTSIGSAFYGCTSLTSVTIPDSVTSLGERVFQNCSALINVEIPDSVTSIGNYAFANCTALTSIEIPESVTSISSSAFNGCDIVICGYEGSAAETYAESSGITFVELCRHLNTEIINAKDVSCTENGYTGDVFCTDCSEVISEGTVIIAAGHDYKIADSKNATCTEDGFMTYACSVCGDTYTETIPAVGHDYSSVTTAASCTEDGYTTYTCINCGESYIADETPATGHDYTSATTAATCTEDGSIVYTCSVCGDTYAETIAAAGHNYELTESKTATCTEDGFITYICSACGDTYTETISASGHCYGEWTVNVEPGYKNEGEQQRTCSVCGNIETETIAMLTADYSAVDESTGVTVSYCEGAYEGELEVSAVPEYDGDSYELMNLEKGNFQYSLYDVTVTVDGEKVQPDGLVLVCIPLPEGYDPSSTCVYYVPNDGSGLVKMNSWCEDGYIYFETDHFSSYAIVDESQETVACSHFCHSESSFVQFFYKIIRFLWKIFGINQYCECGAAHY